jgi:hypothetical protein
MLPVRDRAGSEAASATPETSEGIATKQQLFSYGDDEDSDQHS